MPTVGSVCSGIEAASVAWRPLGYRFAWFSETATFPSRVLQHHYPDVPNIGCMTGIAGMLESGEIEAPDVICGGTPCQSFSNAGWKAGLADGRGSLTLRFADIVGANDAARARAGLGPCIALWENVEGVLSDMSGAFGHFLATLTGDDGLRERRRWPAAGKLGGPLRNAAWRVLDAKHFGLPQQRRRLYLVAGGGIRFPENILFCRAAESDPGGAAATGELVFTKGGVEYEVFRRYTDCLYCAYGTKWNGNAAAHNGSLFVAEAGRLRRFSPTECERLMGLPGGYTAIPGARKTNRYQAIGNSWAVPVARWLGNRLANADATRPLPPAETANTEPWPDNPTAATIRDIIEPCGDETIFITPVGCHGILRRSAERKTAVNHRLRAALERIAGQMPPDEIERISRVQRRAGQ